MQGVFKLQTNWWIFLQSSNFRNWNQLAYATMQAIADWSNIGEVGAMKMAAMDLSALKTIYLCTLFDIQWTKTLGTEVSRSFSLDFSKKWRRSC